MVSPPGFSLFDNNACGGEKGRRLLPSSWELNKKIFMEDECMYSRVEKKSGCREIVTPGND